MATTQEIWDAYLTVAEGLQPLTVPTAPTVGVKGRFIKFLVDKLCVFWGKHRDTLVPFLTQLAIAAIEALVANRTAFDNVNPPGPE